MEKWILEGVFFGETRYGVVRGREVTFFDGAGRLEADATSLDSDSFRGPDCSWTQIRVEDLPTADMADAGSCFMED